MRKRLIKNAAFLLLILLCMYVTYANYRQEEKRFRKELREKVLWMQSQDVASVHHIDTLLVASTNRDTVSLSSLAQGGQRIGVYAHCSQCSDCWKAIARNMNNICKAYHLDAPFVLADGFRVIDMRVVEREDSLDVPIYVLLENEDPYIRNLSLAGKPFVFLLNPNSTISSVTCYNDIIVPVLKEYLKSLSRDSLYTGEVLLEPARFRLGRVLHNREFPLRFTIKNNTRRTCRIKSIDTSCICIRLREAPDSIPPGGTAEVNMVYLSDMVGPFQRTVKVYTDFQKEPYLFSIEGYCK